MTDRSAAGGDTARCLATACLTFGLLVAAPQKNKKKTVSSQHAEINNVNIQCTPYRLLEKRLQL
jgi:hypothetical protein